MIFRNDTTDHQVGQVGQVGHGFAYEQPRYARTREQYQNSRPTCPTCPTEELLDLCWERGIKLRSEGSRLFARAPEGSLDDGLGDALKARRAEVIAHLVWTIEADGPSSLPASSEPGPPASEPVPLWPPRDPRLATWPVRWRERWGRRANELEAQGLGWREAEQRAFVEMLAEKEGPG